MELIMEYPIISGVNISVPNYPSPPVYKEPPPTIDQMVTSALCRLHVSIEANADWQKQLVAKEFALIRYRKLFEKYRIKDHEPEIIFRQGEWKLSDHSWNLVMYNRSYLEVSFPPFFSSDIQITSFGGAGGSGGMGIR